MSTNTLFNMFDRIAFDFNEAHSIPPNVNLPLPNGWTWACDAQGQYISCSQEVADILGIPAYAFTGRSLVDFALSTGSAGALQAAFEKGEFPIDINLDYRHANGVRVPVSLHILPSSSSDGEPVGWHGFAYTLYQAGEDSFPDRFNPQTDLSKAASAMILDLLDNIQETSPIIANFPKNSVTVNELHEQTHKNVPRTDQDANSYELSSTGGVIEIEHKLKWGRKFDFDYDEDLFVRRNRLSARGMRGHLERLSAPQKILKCDMYWFSVILRIDENNAHVWVDLPQVEAGLRMINLSDFLKNPDLLKPEIENAVRNPWESIILYRVGRDYLISPDSEYAIEQVMAER